MKSLARYRKKTSEWLFAKLVICIQNRIYLKLESISIELKGSLYSILGVECTFRGLYQPLI